MFNASAGGLNGDMTAALLAAFHANAMTLVEIAAGLAVCAVALLLAVAPKRH